MIFSSSDAHAVLPASYTFTNADQGVHVFAAAFDTAGTQSLTATDAVTSAIVGSETGVVVTPSAPFNLLVTAPSTVTHGVAFTLTVIIEDGYGNVVTGYRGTIHFLSMDTTAILPPNYTFTATDAGRHTFTNKTTLKKKGTQTIEIYDPLNQSLTNVVSIIVM